MPGVIEKLGVGQIISKQLLQSSTSIGANVEEGQAAQSGTDFIPKYSITRKKARETHYWFRLLAESQIVSLTQLDGLLIESNELIAILTAISLFLYSGCARTWDNCSSSPS